MASLVAYGVCQTACNTAVVACYAAAGLTFGSITAGAGAPVAAIACNALQGTCMSGCAASFLVAGAAETAASGGALGVLLAVGGAALGAAKVGALFAGSVAGLGVGAAKVAAALGGGADKVAVRSGGEVASVASVATGAAAAVGAEVSRDFGSKDDAGVVTCVRAPTIFDDRLGVVLDIYKGKVLVHWSGPGVKPMLMDRDKLEIATVSPSIVEALLDDVAAGGAGNLADNIILKSILKKRALRSRL